MPSKQADAKLTNATVRDLVPPQTGMRITWDGGDKGVKGLGARITAAGARSFVLNYRAAGIMRQLTIGSFPDWTVSAARDKAKLLKQGIDQGGDPMADREAARKAKTVADLATHYREVHLPSKRAGSAQADEWNLAKHIVPRLGRLKVEAVTHADIKQLHREITHGKEGKDGKDSVRGTPVAANRAVALLSKMFALAVVEKWRPDNPVKGLVRNQEAKRDRYLTEDEIARLMASLNAAKNQSSARAIRLLLLTGARRSEVLSATWDQFDLDAGVWVKPASMTKQNKLHRIPLSDDATTLLKEMQAEADAKVAEAKRRARIMPAPSALFPGRGDKMTQANVRKFWASITADCGLTGVHIHDLRHSFASLLVGSGLSLPVVGAMLGHSSSATTQRYAHLEDTPLRAAANVVGAAVRGAKPKVVALKA
jgi:integrase